MTIPESFESSTSYLVKRQLLYNLFNAIQCLSNINNIFKLMLFFKSYTSFSIFRNIFNSIQPLQFQLWTKSYFFVILTVDLHLYRTTHRIRPKGRMTTMKRMRGGRRKTGTRERRRMRRTTTTGSRGWSTTIRTPSQVRQKKWTTCSVILKCSHEADLPWIFVNNLPQSLQENYSNSRKFSWTFT